MQSLLTIIALVLAMTDGFVAGVRYQRDGAVFDRADFVISPSDRQPSFDWPGTALF